MLGVAVASKDDPARSEFSSRLKKLLTSLADLEVIGLFA